MTVRRALPGLQQIRAVALTAKNLPGWNLHGFDGLWPKPLSLVQLLNQLNHWLPEWLSQSAHAGPPLLPGLARWPAPAGPVMSPSAGAGGGRPATAKLAANPCGDCAVQAPTAVRCRHC